MQDDGARLGNNLAIMRMMMVSLPGWACCWLGLAAQVMIYSQVQACAKRKRYIQSILPAGSASRGLSGSRFNNDCNFVSLLCYCCLLGAAVQCCQLQGPLRRKLWGGPLEC